MTTKQQFPIRDVTTASGYFSPLKATVETAFYGTNVRPVTTLTEAYELAKAAPGVIITDLPIQHASDLGLPEDARILVANDGRVVGRTAAARRIIGHPGVEADTMVKVAREAVFQGGRKRFLSGRVVVGLSPDFSVEAHMMLPEAYANNLYSYLLNFQIMTAEAEKHYAQSRPLPEDDLYLYADPDWHDPAYPDGLAIFDPLHNAAIILGLRYFGELKKGTLTLAWATAHRNGFVACHGGMKQYQRQDGTFTMAAFGLSGSGKSTITLTSHGDRYPVKVLHDDAFVIDRQTGATTALEPAYFDKTQDYPLSDPGIRYFLTVQNVGVTLDDHGRKTLVTEDIRNGNGRTVKSRFVTPNRVDHLTQSIDAVFWIMKDDTLPPVVRIENPDLAAAFGATLATKRSTAENVGAHVDRDQLVIEPFANPFRCYPLAEDYQDFYELFQERGTTCYILNTGFYRGQKVKPADTLDAIAAIVDGTAQFQPFGPLPDMSYLVLPTFKVDFTTPDYRALLRKRLEARLAFLTTKETADGGYDKLPEAATHALEKVLTALSESN
ncbi:phosphoenolpyruvate carboxykinase (ATP) [Lacticaseibacillus parahuelsenbergensis]|uniref:phosphoenolpyruvate carboxykinase (ATP) n=1 Tax=Lacticaseibacillus parahuelsenbergensis TaxID=3068305 RepID=A0ABY9KZY0_9LACO|nr:phosphoenolpyruvate carboxykinase (ATP) [Lacticaseibacillus sp. NCIMB 15471]WLV76989.1 phosphoenolpyruvate carboxykinase (ATP) [Lacticaseibacillus sp. NCIMB 15471]